MNRKKKIKAKSKSEKVEKAESIIIDEQRGLVFKTEDEIYNHFLPQIEALEKEFLAHQESNDISDEDFQKHEYYLTQVLQNPTEVWLSSDILPQTPIGTFIGEYESEDDAGETFYYVALTYFAADMPKFVFLHFPTKNESLLNKYRRGNKIFEKGMELSGLTEETVDALSEGDEFAVGLYQIMLKLRSNKDIPEEDFQKYLKYREATIEEPDEVWKFTDSQGHVLVRFIRSITEEDESFYYIVTTLEEEASESQYLLFSFPTKDQNLVDRYKQGECLEAVSYTREESH